MINQLEDKICLYAKSKVVSLFIIPPYMRGEGE